MSKTKTIVIAIVGMPGAGKTVSCQHLGEQNYPVLRFGDQTDIGLKELGLPLTEKNEKQYRENLRHELGMAAYAIKIDSRIRQALKKSPVVILDGLYSWEEYTFLKGKFSNLYLLCIYARPRIRYQRLAKRKIRPLTLEESRQRDIAELKNLNKGGPIAIADYLLKNNKGTDKLYKKLEQTLKLIFKEEKLDYLEEK